MPLSIWERHYRTFAAAILVLAAFNVGFRLDREILTTWDETLYATTAAEILQSGEWIATTFHHQIDYYNAKPPLNVWLIAAAFKAFGISLLSLRLASAVSAWLTIALLQWWCRRCFGAAVALASSLALATMFAFFYLHSGKSGNTDAMFTLLILLTAIALWHGERQPRSFAWIGPLIALSFLLRGMGCLMSIAIVGLTFVARRGVAARERAALAGGLVLGAAMVGAWVAARYTRDGWRFVRELVLQDFVNRVAEPLDGHGGGVFYYLDTLQRDHYDWMTAAVVVLALAVSAAGWRPLRDGIGRIDPPLLRVLLVWAAVALMMPTAMATKLGWYLNPFYPVFAIGVGGAIVWGLSTLVRLARDGASRWRWHAAVAVVVLAAGVAEEKLLWYSYNKRNMHPTAQGLIMTSGDLRGARVFRPKWEGADQFVLEHMRGGRAALGGVAEFINDGAAGDLLLTDVVPTGGSLREVRREGRFVLYAKVDN